MIAPQIDPVALQLGPLAIRWYGLMYVLGFLGVWWLIKRQLIERGAWGSTIKPEQFENLFTWLILGVVLGGRLGYVFFYNFGYYMSHPIEIAYFWQGGMSFHGGLIGPVVAGWWYCKKHDLPFLWLADRFFTVAPLGLAFGRLGNFINGELWGRPVTEGGSVPWAMIFPQAGPELRHPSQLYELALEGIVLFFILWLTRNRAWPDGMRVALFVCGYAVARIFCEFFRQPDAHIGFLAGGWLTIGMLLSSAMLAAGIGGIAWLYTKRDKKT